MNLLQTQYLFDNSSSKRAQSDHFHIALKMSPVPSDHPSPPKDCEARGPGYTWLHASDAKMTSALDS